MREEGDLFSTDDDAATRRPAKSAQAFRTISEVAEDLDLPAHVLRFWETKFPAIKPLKRGGGRRYYRPEDVELLRRIRQLLYNEGYTIKGVQRLFKEGAVKPGASAPAGPGVPASAPPAHAVEDPVGENDDPPDPVGRQALAEILDELRELRELLTVRRG